MRRNRMHSPLAGVTLAALVALALTLVLSSAVFAKGEKKDWRGQPEITSGESNGYFIWSDDSGWHIRWTAKGKAHTFSGTVTTDIAFSTFKPVGKDKKDYVSKPSDNTIKFDARAEEGGKDGADFNLSPSAKKITFDLKIDGAAAPVKDIKMGKKKQSPATNPFSLDVTPAKTVNPVKPK
jgi:hypothetical protein